MLTKNILQCLILGWGTIIISIIIILPTTKVKVIIIGNKIKLVIFYYLSGEPISYKPVEIFLVNLGPIIPTVASYHA